MRSTALSWTFSLVTLASLAACGGGSEAPQASAAAAVVSLEVALGEVTAGAADAAGTVAQPTFHTAAVDLDEPTDGLAPHHATAIAGV